ncbi:MAG: MalY/PatB family protein [Pseudomonadota bacterium]
MFNEIIERRGTNSAKWDNMEMLYGVSPDDGLAMWVADTEFRPPEALDKAVKAALDHGIYGYYVDPVDYPNSIAGWMERRHNWTIDPSHIMTTIGIVNAVSLALQSYTQPGDGVIIFTPVYHAFARIIKTMDRKLIECELKNDNGRYVYDWDAYDAQMDGSAKIVILCSPHNPGGRVWSAEELRDFAAFCERHDLLLVSDEIHHDLAFSGHKHIPTEVACPDSIDRLITMTAPSKTFNLGGLHTGNVIIRDDALRAKYKQTMSALAIGTNTLNMKITEAVYNHGADYADALVAHLETNAKIFDDGINAIPGLKSMKLEGTYLSWVDFTDTGMSREEFTDRVQSRAKIAANHGPTFGTGGESFLRFNIAMPTATIEEAVSRMGDAFSDLQ